MPKGKQAAALFEVIHTDKRFGRSTPPAQALRTPTWWFKAAPARAAEERPEKLATTPDAHRPAGQVAGGPDAGAIALDPDRHRITFRVSYTSAIIAAFTITVVVALAYVVGRHLPASPQPVASASSDDLRQGPAQPQVMDLSAASAAPAGAADPVATARSAAAAPAPAAPTAAAAAPASAPPTRIVSDAQRVTGMQYLVMQSYPEQEEALARAAIEALHQSGIEATMVKGLREYVGASWFAVVGTTGFDKTRGSPEYEQYVRRVMDVSNRFAGTAKFKRFEPKVYTWRPQQ